MKTPARMIVALATLLNIAAQAVADEAPTATYTRLVAQAWKTVKEDHSEFYSGKRLLRMGIATGIGGTLSLGPADSAIQNWYQDDVRSRGTDDFSRFTKNFGEYNYVLPAILVTGLADRYIEKYFDNGMIGDWGQHSMRAYLLGVPMLWTSQKVTGASRPGENRGPGWRPLADNNGVSGHAFTGAVPFLTLARLNENRVYLKYLLYAASTLTALSRINDNAHYFSQAALGWYLAWEATDTVADNEYRLRRLRMSAMPVKDGYGLQVGMRW